MAHPNGIRLLGKSLPFDRISAKLVFTNDRLQIIDLKGTLFSGATRGGATFHCEKRSPLSGQHFRQRN